MTVWFWILFKDIVIKATEKCYHREAFSRILCSVSGKFVLLNENVNKKFDLFSKCVKILLDKILIKTTESKISIVLFAN